MANTGDRTNGCTYGAGCDHNMYTNKCTSGIGFFVLPPEELTYDQDLWYGGSRACSVRGRVLVINSDGHTTRWSAYGYGDKTTGVLVEYDARVWCYSQYQVKRTDGTWYSTYHYSQAFHDSQTRREICTDA